MNKKIEELTIEGVTYVPKDANSPAVSVDGLEYAVIRTYSAGVFLGYIKERKDKEVTVVNCRRIWYWSGANSLSDIAIKGVKNPDICKITAPVSKTILTEVIEILQVSEVAKICLDGVPAWTK